MNSLFALVLGYAEQACKSFTVMKWAKSFGDGFLEEYIEVQHMKKVVLLCFAPNSSHSFDLGIMPDLRSRIPATASKSIYKLVGAWKYDKSAVTNVFS
ncbi:hypothetical protein HAX54_031622 [Datura stramonium]|uniref:DDE-1 domain-containing protein n=1 Tax=Datura stramonium TaxID=4076 RepID=A0ABS8SC50_DATST|nr:hypothetical protein [Datura stramonium]